MALGSHARSAAEIIAEGSRAPLRRCANPACGLLIYDTSRTRRRRGVRWRFAATAAKLPLLRDGIILPAAPKPDRRASPPGYFTYFGVSCFDQGS